MPSTFVFKLELPPFTFSRRSGGSVTN